MENKTIYLKYKEYEKSLKGTDKEKLGLLIQYINKIPDVKVLYIEEKKLCLQYFEFVSQSFLSDHLENLNRCIYKVSTNYNFAARVMKNQ